MFEIFKLLVDTFEGYGDITMCNMSENYSTIDITINDETYMLTIMKEAKEDAD